MILFSAAAVPTPSIPQDYRRRWYVQDAVADAVDSLLRRNPRATSEELERTADNAVRESFRSDMQYSGLLAVYA